MPDHIIIGPSSGAFHLISPGRNTDVLFSEYFMIDDVTALEIMMYYKDHIAGQQISKEMIEAHFPYCAIHIPIHTYQNDEESHSILSAIEKMCRDLPIRNIVIHPDAVVDWSVFKQYSHLPFSIENMDDRKDSCQGIQDIKKILDDNPYLRFTLDLQHAFVNDPTMQLARDLHKELGDKMVQYHISGYHPKHIHYPLFKTDQDIIVKAIERPDLPIIIESSFEEKGDLQKEVDYIKNLIVS